jgi:hypothetical protein
MLPNIEQMLREGIALTVRRLSFHTLSLYKEVICLEEAFYVSTTILLL